MNEKRCNKCNFIHPISLFSKSKKVKSGLSSICKLCDKKYREENKDKMKEYKHDYALKNSDKIKSKNKEYYHDNKEYICKKVKENYDRAKKSNYDKVYRNKNSKSIIEYRKEYYRKNKVKLNYNSVRYRMNRRKTDILYRLIGDVRTMINKAFKINGYTKKSKTIEMIGCTFEEFKNHIKGKFEPWMNWENKGLYNGTPNYGWDIDHIIPLSSANTEEELLKLNHYTNLQPLCSYINRNVKKDKNETLLN